MKLRSLGYRTDLLVLARSARITDRGDHLVIESPGNPSYYWGNLLLFPGPPGPGDHERWRALFARELGSREGVQHETFGWDGTDGATGEVEPFLAAGFELDRCHVLTAREVRRPERRDRDAECRRLSSEEDWRSLLALDLACNDRIEAEPYRVFAEKRLAELRRSLAAGAGAWHGAFVEGRLVASLGLIAGEGLGRYQAVQTHPDFRRRGLCARLVVEAARDAAERLGVEQLVLVADRGSAAERIYRSCGFEGTEQQLGLCRSPHRVPASD